MNVVKTFGTELEFYSKSHTYHDAGELLRDYPVKCVKEMSLVNGDWQTSKIAKTHHGIEVKSDGAQCISTFDQHMDMFYDIATHKEMNPVYNEDDGWGTTGLHFHFGIGDYKVTPVDYLRLMINAATSDDKIRQLSKRGMTQWSQSTIHMVSELRKHLKNCTPFNMYDWTRKKYHGVNVNPLNDGSLGTIEFRYATASLLLNKSEMKQYVDACIGLLEESLTGEDSIEFDGYIIKLESVDIWDELAIFNVISPDGTENKMKLYHAIHYKS